MKRIELENGNYKKIYYFDKKETKIQSEQYYNSKDKLHRTGRPATIFYYKTKEIEYEDYIINNKYHRLDGPARIWYFKFGEIESEQYWINGNDYKFKNNYDGHPEVIKLRNINRNLKLLNKK